MERKRKRMRIRERERGREGEGERKRRITQTDPPLSRCHTQVRLAYAHARRLCKYAPPWCRAQVQCGRKCGFVASRIAA
jgi:hypothetical protein